MTSETKRWREHARCGDRDGSAWDLTGEVDDPARLTDANRKAMAVCATCPVAKRCFDEALEFGDAGVIRGAIPLWVRMERYRCAGCRKVALRSVRADRRAKRRRRYCDHCVRRSQSRAVRETWAEVAA